MTLATAAASLGAQVPEYVCSRATAPIRVDGVPDEKAWASAKVIDGFMTLGPKGEKAKNTARVRLLFDNKRLYIGGDLAAMPGRMPLTLKASRRDYSVWGNDCIDIFLQPREGQPITYQLMLSAHGHLHDAQNKPGVGKPEVWNGQIEVKTKQRLGGWSFEMAVPFADLGRRPFRGDVWAFRMGLAANGYEMAMWPHNRELSFHNKSCRGYLIFENRNLLANGDFEVLPAKTGDASPGWRFIVNKDPAVHGKGTIRVVTLPDAPQGPHVAELHKTDQPGYWPALVCDHLPIEPGATYEFSAFVKAEKPFYAGASFSGPETKDPRRRFAINGARKYPASPTFRKITVRHPGDARVTTGAVLFRYEGEQGRMWVDGVGLMRVNGLARAGRPVKQADPIHNLVELSLRTGFKPFALLKRPDGWYRNERTIFKDSGTGATIWKMSHHPGYICRQQYMERSPWSCNGERLCLVSLPQWWRIFMKADGSAWRPAATASSDVWDRLDPETLWFTASGRLVRQNVVTGETLNVKTFRGNATLWSMSRDAKYLLLKENLTADGKTTSRIHLVPRDVRRGHEPEVRRRRKRFVSPEQAITLDPGEQIHQLWFTNRPDHSVVFGYEAYLRGGAVMTPDGMTVKRIKYGTGMMPGGHNAPSPSGKWAVSSEGYIFDWLTEKINWISDHRTNHQSWGPDDTWFIGSAGFDLRRFGIPPRRFDQLLGSANSRMKYNIYWSEVHPVVSPDGTKLGYASDMLGYIEFYALIMRLPERPIGLRLARAGRGLRLAWKAPKASKELALYRIYRSNSLNGPYEPVAAVPKDTTVYDVAVNSQSERAEAARRRARPVAAVSRLPIRRDYFVVTAQEHSGLESCYSNPVATGRERGRFLVSIEAESGDYAAPCEEIFDPTAADLYGVSLGTAKPSAGLTLRMPHGADGWVLARVKNILREAESELSLVIGGETIGVVPVKEKAWHWLNLTGEKPIRLKPDTPDATLTPLGPGVAVDQVVVVDNLSNVPKVLWGRDPRVPQPVTGFSAQQIDPYTVRLTWTPPKDADIAHYNLYAARGSTCEPGNETLIVSPTEPEVLDWGLMADTQYAYRVTAVDRAGNESECSQVLTLTTPPVKDRIFIRHPCAVRTKGRAALEVPIELPAPAEVLFWIKVRCFNQNPVARFKVLLDNEELCEPYQIPWRFITPHHPGPARDVWLWAYIDGLPRTGTSSRRRLLPVPAGGHTLTLVPDAASIKRYGDIDVEFGEVIITNDLGYTPRGITNFLINPTRGRESRSGPFPSRKRPVRGAISRVHGLRFRVWGSRLGVQGSGFGVREFQSPAPCAG